MDIENIGQAAARLKWIDGLSWSEVEKRLGQHRDAFRTPARRYKELNPGEFPQVEAPQIEGVTAGDVQPDAERAYQRAVDDWHLVQRLEERRRAQSLKFAQPVIALAWSADWHLGGQGVDYPALRRDLELIADTPGMYLAVGGDLLDNFILGQMRAIRDDARAAIPDEWALARLMLEIAADKIVMVVEGNHDKWTQTASGISYFADVVGGIAAKALYDSDEVTASMTVGTWSNVIVKARHKWRGFSEVNPTHGPEKSSRFERDFHIGLAAHTHTSGLTRQFRMIDPATQQPGTGIALLAGSYKRYDSYARTLGLPEANASTTVVVVIDSRHRALVGFDNMQCAAAWLGEVM